MKKQDLRRIYLKKRKDLSDIEYLQGNHQITEQFFSSFPPQQFESLHTFLPNERNREPDTWLIISRLQKDFPHVRISIPKIEGQRLRHFYLNDIHLLQNNEWGIPELDDGEPAQLDEIKMVLVPLIAFDAEGNRIGYGKGFYDRFLKQLPAEAIRVGLGFFEPVQKIDDIEPHDVPLDFCITPKECYRFNND